MEFRMDHPIIYALVAITIAAVLGQSVFFLWRALKKAKELKMDKAKIRATILSSLVFTIAPAVSIIICVMTLSKSLGVALPWLRLSVVGSLSYETVAANNALSGMALKLGEVTNLTGSQFVTVVFVMTISIMAGVLLTPIASKKIQGGLQKMEKRDKRWSAIFSDSLFMGMIAAFLGFVFCDFSGVFVGELSGLVPVLVMLSSAVLMAGAGALMKVTGWKFLNDYALPISMVGGMLLAIPYSAWLG
ncbi:MAG: DUF5058 family protein [Clostridia bacterium]|nr:DUF5058 family protein [Clostridia bacterium]